MGLTTASAQNKPIEIQMWMGLTGLGGETLVKYGEEFNRMQNEYKVTVSFKGQYPEQRAAAIAAFRAGNPPHIMQMFDAGSGDMMSAKNAIVPVSEVFKRAGLSFNPADFIAPARGYYGLKDGSLLSMPFNVSTAVLFYTRMPSRRPVSIRTNLRRPGPSCRRRPRPFVPRVQPTAASRPPGSLGSSSNSSGLVTTFRLAPRAMAVTDSMRS